MSLASDTIVPVDWAVTDEDSYTMVLDTPEAHFFGAQAISGQATSVRYLLTL